MASDMDVTFYSAEQRERTRKTLEDVLALANECLTPQQIWHEVHCALGLDDDNRLGD